jgi:hypothetical protein
MAGGYFFQVGLVTTVGVELMNQGSLGIWRSVKRPEAKPRTQAGRVRAYILMMVFISVCVLGQWIMGEAILAAGGYLAE